jgi:hypothetical protein
MKFLRRFNVGPALQNHKASKRTRPQFFFTEAHKDNEMNEQLITCFKCTQKKCRFHFSINSRFLFFFNVIKLSRHTRNSIPLLQKEFTHVSNNFIEMFFNRVWEIAECQTSSLIRKNILIDIFYLRFLPEEIFNQAFLWEDNILFV